MARRTYRGNKKSNTNLHKVGKLTEKTLNLPSSMTVGLAVDPWRLPHIIRFRPMGSHAINL